MKYIIAISLYALFSVLAVASMLYGGFAAYEYFAPKYAAVDNKVFKESQQYNEGMIRDLENLKMTYDKASPSEKDALRDVIIHRFSVYSIDRLPLNLQIFYSELTR